MNPFILKHTRQKWDLCFEKKLKMHQSFIESYVLHSSTVGENDGLNKGLWEGFVDGSYKTV